MKYIVKVLEILATDVEIEAKNLKDAMLIAKNKYDAGDIVLTGDDFKEVSFHPAESPEEIAKRLILLDSNSPESLTRTVHKTQKDSHGQ